MKELEQFNQLRSEVASLVSPSLEVSVKTAHDAHLAVKTAQTIVMMRKRVDGLRKEITDPLNTQIKKINAYAKDICEPLEFAETHIRTELNLFAQEQEKVRREELRKVEEEKRRQIEILKKKQEEERASALEIANVFGVGEEQEIEIEQKQQKERISQIVDHKAMEWDANQLNLKNTRKKFSVKILDVSIVPKEFLIITVNEKAAVSAMRNGVTIKGLELVEELAVAIGSKTRVPSKLLEGERHG